MRARALIVALLALAAALLVPALASAHATLEGSSPERGANLREAPESVELQFSEPVEASFGSLRVFSSEGDTLGDLETFRPDDDGSALGVRLPADLEDGTYTVTYRVISADSHPVSGGFVFSVGDAGTAPSESVSDLLDDTEAGTATQASATVARFLTYAATGLAVGVFAFALLVFLPAVRQLGKDETWQDATDAFGRRAKTLVVIAAGAGLVGGALGIVTQGAIAGGTSVWDALDSGVISDVLGTRFGTVWGIRELAWVGIGVAALSGLLWSRGRAVALVPALAFLVVAPSLSGHASTYSPEWLMVSANIGHVAAMSIWVGGVAALAFGVRSATRALDPADRTRLLSATLIRFSPIALASVLVLTATGTVQAITYLDSVSDLWETGFGRALLAKIILLGVLVGIGIVHRRRSLPRLRAAADGGSPPGQGGKFAMKALRAEIALFVAVLAVTGILVGEQPSTSVAEGPQSASTTVGGARLDVTVDPALVGSNELHLYLTDPEDGSQLDDLTGVTLQASLPAEDLGPIEIDLEKSGPGHYTAPDAQLGVPGTWELTFSGRLSRFDEPRGLLEVEIE